MKLPAALHGLLCALVVLGPGAAHAAFLGAYVAPTKFFCAEFGDPNCAGGQVINDPDLAMVYSTNNSAAPGALVVADKTYFDPRIGTTNVTDGAARASLGLLRATAGASVSSSPPLGSGSPNLMRLGTFSTARFSDEVTIVPANPTFVGATGNFTASIEVDGLLDVSGVNGLPVPSTMAYADWRIEVRVDSPSPVGTRIFGSTSGLAAGFHGYRMVGADGTLTLGGLGPDGTVTFTSPIVLGVPFTLSVTFQSSANAVLSSSVTPPLTSGLALSSAESIYMSTAVWNGVSSVRLGSMPIASSIQSPSGLDYSVRPDFDADGLSDDADDCPYFASPDQTDTDGNGRGNVCECGDQNGDGHVDVRDLLAINLALFNPGLVTPLCDANGDGLCNVSDIVAANLDIFSPATTSICARQPNPGP